MKKRERKLSKAEQRRQEKFDRLNEQMLENGYSRKELTISIAKANVFAVILLVPLAVIGFCLFFQINGAGGVSAGPGSMFAFLISIFVLVVVHELIHGACWAIFSKNHLKDIEFGIMMPYLAPYCTCAEPLTKGQYLFGALMPLLLLGILPMIVGILAGSMPMLLIGILLADGAAGDIMIAWKVIRFKSSAKEVVFIDHPTQGGGVVFEK